MFDPSPHTPPLPISPEVPPRLLSMLNEAALALMVSIGHRTGLLDTLASMPPSTIEEIALRAGLQEGPVRDWLGALTAGGIVQYLSSENLYLLSPGYAAHLSRQGGADNLAPWAQLLSALGELEEDFLRSFRFGCGVAFGRYEKVQEILDQQREAAVARSLISDIIPTHPRLGEVLLGGAQVLALSSGRGGALRQVAKAFPGSRFYGYDISDSVTTAARKAAQLSGLGNLFFVTGEVPESREARCFDLVMALQGLQNLTQPKAALAAVQQVLDVEGLLLLWNSPVSNRLEENLAHPAAPWHYTLSCLYRRGVATGLGQDDPESFQGREDVHAALVEMGFTSIGKDPRHGSPSDRWTLWHKASVAKGMRRN
ncbi:MAG: class I SAM-dependent methyltransferase [Deltaproteobacteria bacterium]|nr:class I SAM-dependent methyltransferase [Deltaproteobacteria bacterium]